MTAKPFSDSYWVIADRFLAGSYPIVSREETSTSRRLTALLEAGVDTFFDLTRPGENTPYLPLLEEQARRYNRQVRYHRHPIRDWGLPTPAEMAKLLDAIDEALAAGRTIYLHCLGGIGRTGTTVGCWLVRHGMSGEEALAHLNSLYRTAEQSKTYSRSPEVDAQVNFILDWKESASSAAPAVDWHARFLQQASWTKDLRAYLFEQAGLARAQSVLEVGCGTGAILSDLQGEAAIHGLDLDPLRLAEAAANAASGMPHLWRRPPPALPRRHFRHDFLPLPAPVAARSPVGFAGNGPGNPPRRLCPGPG